MNLCSKMYYYGYWWILTLGVFCSTHLIVSSYLGYTLLWCLWQNQIPPPPSMAANMWWGCTTPPSLQHTPQHSPSAELPPLQCLSHSPRALAQPGSMVLGWELPVDHAECTDRAALHHAALVWLWMFCRSFPCLYVQENGLRKAVESFSTWLEAILTLLWCLRAPREESWL